MPSALERLQQKGLTTENETKPKQLAEEQKTIKNPPTNVENQLDTLMKQQADFSEDLMERLDDIEHRQELDGKLSRMALSLGVATRDKVRQVEPQPKMELADLEGDDLTVLGQMVWANLQDKGVSDEDLEQALNQLLCGSKDHDQLSYVIEHEEIAITGEAEDEQ